MSTEVPPILTVVRDKTALSQLTLQGLAAGILAARQATTAQRTAIHTTAVAFEEWDRLLTEVAHEEGSNANACATWDKTMMMLGLKGRNIDDEDEEFPATDRSEVEVRYPITTTVRTADVVATSMNLRGTERSDFIADFESRLAEQDRVKKTVRFNTTWVYAYADDDGCVCDWVDRPRARAQFALTDPEQHIRTINCTIHRATSWDEATGKTEQERAAMLARRPEAPNAGFDDEVLIRIWPKLTVKARSVSGQTIG